MSFFNSATRSHGEGEEGKPVVIKTTAIFLWAFGPQLEIQFTTNNADGGEKERREGQREKERERNRDIQIERGERQREKERKRKSKKGWTNRQGKCVLERE